jgi:hypothetical protein
MERQQQSRACLKFIVYVSIMCVKKFGLFIQVAKKLKNGGMP